MSAWNQILSAALVGMDRQPRVELSDVDPALGDVLPTGLTGPVDLLHAAGSFALAARVSAGPFPTKHTDGADDVVVTSYDAPPAEHDERAIVPRAAAWRLSRILSGPQSDENVRLAVDWLRIAEETGRRVPYDLLPALLDLGSRRRDARGPVLTLGGPRATWLASHDLERWSWVARTSTDGVGEPSEPIDVFDRSVWDGGDVHAKVAFLAALRVQDPAASRDLLLDSWEGLRATDLAMLTPVVRDTLEPADEEWLERALDAGVRAREAASALLRKLPDSGLARRMRDRIRSWVSDVDGVLHIALPQDLDADMKRDGIVVKPPVGSKQGERAWWFEQVVGAAPLDAWTGLVDDLVELSDRKTVPDLGRELCCGLARAAARQKDYVLAVRWGSDPRADSGLLPELAQMLTPEAAASLVAERLRTRDMDRIYQVLDGLPTPWPDDVAQAALDYMTPPYGKVDRWVGRVAHAACAGMPLSWLDRVREVADLDTSHSDIRSVVAHLETLAKMRADLYAVSPASPVPPPAS